jgi:peptidoglycan/xylan/chitin deacetylase (PgdA/CDA1 family)
MKRIRALSLLIIMTLILISCAQKETDTMNNSKNNEIAPTDVPAEPTPEPTPTPLPTPTEVPEIDYSDKKLVALTFDDGPNLDITPLVLDKLEEHGVVASFFLIGKYISEDTKPIMERQLELGCEIANHSWNHNQMNQYTSEDIIDEINKTNDIINEMVNVTPQFFRPPYISTSATMYEAIDLSFINGINCLDWDGSVTAEKRAESILNNVSDGAIILLHDFSGNKNTVDALDAIIVGLLDDGYALVTVSELFEIKGVDPNVENKIWTNTNW